MFRCHVWLAEGILALYFAKGIWWGSVPGDSLWNIGGSGRWECGYQRLSPSQPLFYDGFEEGVPTCAEYIWVLDCAAAIVGVNGMFRKMRHHHGPKAHYWATTSAKVAQTRSPGCRLAIGKKTDLVAFGVQKNSDYSLATQYNTYVIMLVTIPGYVSQKFPLYVQFASLSFD